MKSPNSNNTKMATAKKSKRVIPQMTYNVNSVEDYMMYAGTDKTQSFVFNLAFDAIRNGIAEGAEVSDMFCLPGEKNNNTFSIPKSEWKSILKKSIQFYSKLKEYEKCIDCQQLIAALESK